MARFLARRLALAVGILLVLSFAIYGLLDVALDPLSAHWFVFCNRGRDKLKILYWDHNGFWLYYRRLERGRFSWPAQAPSAALSITARQLAWLLDGLALEERVEQPEVCAGHGGVPAPRP